MNNHAGVISHSTNYETDEIIYEGLIFGHDGSTAETYAKTNNREFYASVVDYYSDFIVDQEGLLIRCNPMAEGAIVLPDTVKSIEKGAFANCKKIESVVVPSGVEAIEITTFANCSALKSVVLPDSITYVDATAFQNSPNVTITYKGKTYSPSDLVALFGGEVSNGDSYLIMNKFGLESCDPNAQGDIVIPDTVTFIERGAFANCKKIESVVVPNGVVGIETSTFANCPALKSVVLPDSITYVDPAAFKNSPNVIITYKGNNYKPDELIVLF